MVIIGTAFVALTLATFLQDDANNDAVYSPLGAVNRSYFMGKLANSFATRADTGQSAICLAVQVDDYTGIIERHGSVAADQVMCLPPSFG